ncbi:histidine kinase [Streptomyces tanashiensis]
MLRLPTVPALRRCVDRWAVSPRALDVVAALSAFGLMVLDVPGLARADNSLTGVTATLVLAAGAATLVLRRRLPWLPYAVALGLMGWLHELTMIQFALYSIGRYRGRRAAIAATLLYVGVAYGFAKFAGPVRRTADRKSRKGWVQCPVGTAP